MLIVAHNHNLEHMHTYSEPGNAIAVKVSRNKASVCNFVDGKLWANLVKPFPMNVYKVSLFLFFVWVT